jgi:hypothetical protein
MLRRGNVVFWPGADKSRAEIPHCGEPLTDPRQCVILRLWLEACGMQFRQVRRREFLSLLGAATAWPGAARAQQPGKLRTVGFLGAATPSAASQWVAALVQRLHELGWIEGRTIAIEYRWAEGNSERLAEIAAEFVRLNVDVIVTWGTSSVLAAKQATSVIPIVFASAGDPVGTGLVASLARPGANVTGSSNQAADVAGKRLELLREFIPGLRHLAVLANISSPIGVLQIGEAEVAARTLGLEVTRLEIVRAQDHACVGDPQRTGTGALRGERSARIHSSVSHPYFGDRCATANNARLSRVCGSRRSDVLRAQLPSLLPTHRRLCRQDIARGEARRSPGRAAHKIRFRP